MWFGILYKELFVNYNLSRWRETNALHNQDSLNPIRPPYFLPYLFL